MFKRVRIGVAVFGLVAVAATASAQAWRGQGQVHGKVTDEAGKPIDGVTVKLFLPSANGGTDTKTNNKGEWALAGIAGGAWQVDFTKQGYEPRQITVPIQELTRIPTVETVMKKAVDPNKIIADEIQKASALVSEGKFDEARAIYAELQAKYPQAYQLEIQIARSYDAQGDYAKEIEHLKKYIEKDPENVGMKLLTGGVMIAKGNAEEGEQLLSSVDDSQVTEPAIFLNVGITLLNLRQDGEPVP
jgi:tetratricopeptide (TPR) repeat protein